MTTPRRRRHPALLAILVACAATSSCAADPGFQSPTAAAVTPTPKAVPTAATPDTLFWLELTEKTPGGLKAEGREELVESGHEVCDSLDEEDLLMGGTVAAWSAWVDGDAELAPIFWQAAVDTLCPDRADEWQSVQDLKDALNP